MQELQLLNLKNFSNLNISDKNTNIFETKQLSTGAESVAEVTEAVAEIEMEEDDTNITVDMPEITRFIYVVLRVEDNITKTFFIVMQLFQNYLL